MARIRFFTDEQVSKAVAMGLRRRGVEVLTVPEAGTLGASDAAQPRRRPTTLPGNIAQEGAWRVVVDEGATRVT